MIEHEGVYYGFKNETYQDRYQLYKYKSRDLAFNDIISRELFMPAGISSYDEYSIIPSVMIEDSNLSVIAITNPRQPTDYGFDNENKIVMYKADLKYF